MDEGVCGPMNLPILVQGVMAFPACHVDGVASRHSWWCERRYLGRHSIPLASIWSSGRRLMDS